MVSHAHPKDRTIFYVTYVLILFVTALYFGYLVQRAARQYKNPLTKQSVHEPDVFEYPKVALCTDNNALFGGLELVDVLTPARAAVGLADVPLDISQFPFLPPCSYHSFNPKKSVIDKSKECTMVMRKAGARSCAMYNLEDQIRVKKLSDFALFAMGVNVTGTSILQKLDVLLFDDEDDLDNEDLLSLYPVPFGVSVSSKLTISYENDLAGFWETVFVEETGAVRPDSRKRYSLSSQPIEFAPEVYANLTTAFGVSELILMQVSVASAQTQVYTKYVSLGPLEILGALGGAWSLLVLPLSFLFIETVPPVLRLRVFSGMENEVVRFADEEKESNEYSERTEETKSGRESGKEAWKESSTTTGGGEGGVSRKRGGGGGKKEKEGSSTSSYSYYES